MTRLKLDRVESGSKHVENHIGCPESRVPAKPHLAMWREPPQVVMAGSGY